MKRLTMIIVAIFILLAFGVSNVQARNRIRIVGSSTVFPYASYVCEELGATTQYATPVIESTGSGGGFKLFSKGVSLNTPDITDASRQMKLSEYKRCMKNGVKKIHEIIFAYDGISICENVNNPNLNLSLKELTLAVAAKVPQDGNLVQNPYKYWNQIHSSLPHRKILIYGPPSTSGTRDDFEKLVMKVATKKMPGYDKAYIDIRQDGVYISCGENDNLTVQRLERNKKAMGIFGYSYLDNNRNKIQSIIINGINPDVKSISSGNYPLTRKLYFYVKLDHLNKVQGMKEYINLFLSRKMTGGRGYLQRQGLISMPKKIRNQEIREWRNRKLLQKSDLK